MKREKETEKVEIVWDKKSTIKLIQTVLILAIVILGIHFIPGFFRDRKANDLNGRTTGIVVKIESKSVLTQGFYGQRESPYSYELTFVYTVNSKTFTNTNNFPFQEKYFGFIRSIRNSKFSKKVDVNYNEKDPQESLIIAE